CRTELDHEIVAGAWCALSDHRKRVRPRWNRAGERPRVAVGGRCVGRVTERAGPLSSTGGEVPAAAEGVIAGRAATHPAGEATGSNPVIVRLYHDHVGELARRSADDGQER